MSLPDEDDPDSAPSGDVPEGVGADLYPRHLEHLSRHEAYQDAVLSFPDAAGRRQDVALNQVAEIEEPSQGSSGRGRILLRNGAIVLASGAVIAAAIAALRYRRTRK